MSKLLSNMLLRGIARTPNLVPASMVGLGSTSMQRIMYSSDTTQTRVTSDPDTHEDFQPITKSSGGSLFDVVDQDVKKNPVMIYMKGLPEAPRCGFSALAVKVLQRYEVPIGARDILADRELKEAVKAHTNWPTFPQVFIKGEFVGGSDILLDMHQKGELLPLIADIAKNDSKGNQEGS